MPFVSPMLGSPLPDRFDPLPGEWVAEEKYDGHRIVASVGDPGTRALFDEVGVAAWSRYGKDRALPPQVRAALATLPRGTYDGELLVPGERSYGVTVKADAAALVFVVFDVLQLGDTDLTAAGEGIPLENRRAMLESIAAEPNEMERGRGALRLGWLRPVESFEHVKALALEVWGRDGEGLILKRAKSLYLPGKRTKDWVKVKQLRTAVLTVVGYQPGKMGPRATLVLRDDEGYETTVKWKNLEELRKLDADPPRAIGRRLAIEFQERTPDGGYRHPRWDRWEDE